MIQLLLMTLVAFYIEVASSPVTSTRAFDATQQTRDYDNNNNNNNNNNNENLGGTDNNQTLSELLVTVTSLSNPFLLNQPQLCSQLGTPRDPHAVFLLVVVCSRVDHAYQRQAVRDTWASVKGQVSREVKVIFLTGLPPSDNDNHIQETLRDESRKYGDIVQANFSDTYRHLTIKSLLMLKWTHLYCSSVKYLLKVDDDTFVHLPSLLLNLRTTGNHHFIMGSLISGAHPLHDKTSKYYTTHADYTHVTYPQYVSGSAYVISGDVIHKLYMTCRLNDRGDGGGAEEVFWIEDVYVTGMCAKRAKVTLIHNNRFKSFINKEESGAKAHGGGGAYANSRVLGALSSGMSTACRRQKWMALHRIYPQQMYALHKAGETMCL